MASLNFCELCSLEFFEDQLETFDLVNEDFSLTEINVCKKCSLEFSEESKAAELLEDSNNCEGEFFNESDLMLGNWWDR